MSLLSIVQRFYERTNLNTQPPSTVYGSTDPQVLQVKALLEEVGIDLAARGAWEQITVRATFNAIADEDQGPITHIATRDFNYIKDRTFWDLSARLPVLGPLDAEEWEALKAVLVTGPRYYFRILNGNLLLNPAPPLDESMVFEYVSKDWIVGADGTTYKQYFTLDTDEPMLPQELLLMGLRAWWKKEKGLDYAEDYRMYEMQASDALGRNAGNQTLHMDGAGWDGPKPGIWVPQWSWNLP